MIHRLEWISYTNFTGYGQAARNMVLALHRSGQYDIKLTPLDVDMEKLKDEDSQIIHSLITKKSDPRRIQVFQCIPDMQRRFSKTIRSVGYGIFETTDPPRAWAGILNQNDAVIVPSKFNFDCFTQSGVTKPIFHIPHCLDMNLYRVDVVPMKRYNRFSFLFLGAWRERKGYKELLDAWQQEFSLSDRVQLVIKTDRGKVAESLVKQLVSSRGTAPIIVDDNRYSEREMPSFIKSHQCLVSPNQGEGFGISPVQSMAVGVPVIVTNYSGCQDYATEETAFLLEPKEFVLKKCLDGVPQFCNKKWANICVDQLRQQMRFVLEHPQVAKEKEVKARCCVEANFGYNNIVDEFAKLMVYLSSLSLK